MTARSPAEAAEYLWACATHDGGAPVDVGAAAERLCSELGAELGRWIGADGFRALVQRAQAIARAQHPALDGFSCLGGKQAEKTAAAPGHTHDTAVVAAGMVAWLSALIELLGRIIGDDMATHLVAQIEIPSLRAVAKIGSEEERNG
jgi:hypothetical protein